MLYIAFQLNPQGEFYNILNGDINIINSFQIFFSWFIVVSVVIFLIELIIISCFRVLKSYLTTD